MADRWVLKRPNLGYFGVSVIFMSAISSMTWFGGRGSRY
jgi:hypothetical protein